MKKRFDALIAIIRDVEKHQTQPTAAMVQLLFEHAPQNGKVSVKASPPANARPAHDTAFFESAFESVELQKENTRLKQQLERQRTELRQLLQKVQVVKNSFGKSRLQLDMDVQTFETLKESLNP